MKVLAFYLGLLLFPLAVDATTNNNNLLNSGHKACVTAIDNTLLDPREIGLAHPHNQFAVSCEVESFTAQLSNTVKARSAGSRSNRNGFLDLDSDNDGQLDSVDNDDDNDGIRDDLDAFPLDPVYWQDSDNDGIADAIDTDLDNDGVLNTQDIAPDLPEYAAGIDASQQVIPQEYVNPQLSVVDFPRYAMGQNYPAFVFSQDGSGHQINVQSDTDFTWTQSSNGLSLEYAANAEGYRQSYPVTELLTMGVLSLDDLNPQDGQLYDEIWVEVDFQAITSQWYLMAGGDSPTWLSTTQSTVTFPNAWQRAELFGSEDEISVTFSDSSLLTNLLDTASFDSAWDANSLQGQWVLPVHLDANFENRLVAVPVTFNTDGSGVALDNAVFAWVVDAGVLRLIFADYSVTLINHNSADGLLEVYASATHGSGFSRRGFSVVTPVSAGVVWQDLQNQYLQNSFSLTEPTSYDANGELLLDSYFGFRLEIGGAITRIFGQSATPEQPYYSDRWYWSDDGDSISLTARMDLTTGDIYSDCELSEDCVVWRHRHWMPLKRDGDRLYVLEWSEIRRWQGEGDGVMQPLIPRRVQYYQIFDLDWDSDGVVDSQDTDDDNDGVLDPQDSRPFDETISDADSDNDGQLDSVDNDDDNDGIRDEQDAFPYDVYAWADTDGDGIANRYDTDWDNDGVLNTQDIAPDLPEYAAGIDASQQVIPQEYVNPQLSVVDFPRYATGQNYPAFVFSQDGSGHQINVQSDTDFTWTQSESGLSLVYAAGAESYRQSYPVTELLTMGVLSLDDLNPQDGQLYDEIWVEVDFQAITSQWYLMAGGDSPTWLSTTQSTVTFPNAWQRAELFGSEDEISVTFSDSSLLTNLVDTASFDSAWDANSLQGQWVLPVHLDANFENRLVAVPVTFNTDGSGVALDNAVFAWVVDAGVLRLIFADYSVTLINHNSADGLLEVYASATHGSGFSRRNFSVVTPISTDVVWQGLQNQYLQNSFSLTDPTSYDANGELLLDSYFGFRLEIGGAITRIFGQSATPEQPYYSDRWYWSDDGDSISLTARMDLTTDYIYSDCELSDDCVVWRHRHWMPLKRDGDRLYVLEWSEIRRTQDDDSVVMQPFIPRRVQYYQIYDLDWDSDGVVDSQDTDDDNDGVLDLQDSRPFDETISDADSDNDGQLDSVDNDDDNDGIRDEQDAFPYDVYAWADTDGDGIANRYDTDWDNDGVLNTQDIAPRESTVSTYIAMDSAELLGTNIEYFSGALAFPKFRIGYNYGAVDFLDDGTGKLSTPTSDSTFTWSDSGEFITLNMAEQSAVSYPMMSLRELLEYDIIPLAQLNLAAGSDIDQFAFQIEQSVVQQRLFKIDENSWWYSHTTKFVITDEAALTSLFGDTQVREYTTQIGGYMTEYLSSDTISNQWERELLVGQWVLPVEKIQSEDVGIQLKATSLTFSSDTSGTLSSGESFTWQLLDDNLTLSFDSYTVSLLVLNREGLIHEVFATASMTTGETRVRVELAMPVDPQTQWQGLQDLYLQNSFSLTDPGSYSPDGSLNNDAYYGFRLQSDGKVTRIYDGEFDPQANNSGWDFWDWTLLNDRIQLTNYYNPETFDRGLECPELSATCQPFRKRYWLPLQRANDRLYVLEWSEIIDTNDETLSTWRPFVTPRVQFYQVYDLDWNGDGVVETSDSASDEYGDFDGDQIPNGADVFPLGASEWRDTDLDGIGDRRDTDDDNDGVLDAFDPAPLDPAISKGLDVNLIENDQRYIDIQPGQLALPAHNMAVINGRTYQLNSDGTGFLTQFGQQTFTWQAMSDHVLLSYDAPVVEQQQWRLTELVASGMFDDSDSSVVDADLNGYHSITVTTTGHRLFTVNTESDNSLRVLDKAITEVVIDSNDTTLLALNNGSTELAFETQGNQYQLYPQATLDTVSVSEQDLVGVWVMPLQIGASFQGNTLLSVPVKFDSNGVGELLNSNQSFTWQLVDSDTLSVVVENGDAFTLSFHQQLTSGLVAYSVANTNDDNQYSRYGLVIKQQSDINVDGLINYYLQNSFSLTDPAAYDADGKLLNERLFGFRLESNNFASRIYSAATQATDVFNGWDQWQWSVGTDGIIRIYSHATTSEFFTRCELSDTCVEFRQRFWQPLALEGDKLFVLEWEEDNSDRQANLDGTVSETRWETRIAPRVQFYQLLDLDWDQDGIADNDDPDFDNDMLANGNDPYPFDDTLGLDLLADDQVVTLSSTEIELTNGQSQSFTLDYQDVSQKGTDALTLQAFFNPLTVTLESTLSYAFGYQNTESVLVQDVSDLDNDPATTHYLSFTWIAPNNNRLWPAETVEGPFDVSLLTFAVTATDAMEGDITINIGKKDGGDEFEADSLLIGYIKAPTFDANESVMFEATGVASSLLLTPPQLDDATASLSVSIQSATDTADIVVDTLPFTAEFTTGETTIVWTAISENGLSSTFTQTVVVEDTTPPVITGTANVEVEANGVLSSIPSDLISAIDIVSGDNVTISREPSGLLPLGTNTVIWTATDSSQQESNFTQTITVVDTLAPIIPELETLTIAASGRLTALHENLLPTVEASDLHDGIVTAQLLTTEPLESGVHTVLWQAIDAQNNSSVQQQTVHIEPQVMIDSLAYVEVGSTAIATVKLLGDAPVYPVELSYEVNTSLNSTAHTAVAGSLVINQGQQASIEFDLLTEQGIVAEDTVELQLIAASNAVLSEATVYRAVAVLQNEAPMLDLQLQQAGANTRFITANADNAVLTANVSDINAGDTHSLLFLVNNVALVDLDTDNDVNTFEFSTQSLDAGSYIITVTATENNTVEPLSSVSQLLFIVEETAITLSDEVDSDNDGISDQQEGLGDSDGDGIADFQDNSDVTTELPLGETFSNPMQTVAGVTLRLGTTALSAQGSDANNANISAAELAQFGNAGQSSPQSEDESFQAISAIVDFEVVDLPKVGMSVAVVLPLPDGVVLQENTVYRKFDATNGWITFIEDADNTIESAPLTITGACPGADSDVYVSGLNAGHQCVRLTLLDGGQYDQDGEANGQVADPGTFAVQVINTDPVAIIDGGTDVTEGQLLSLDGTASFDPEGQVLSYSWSQLSGPALTFVATAESISLLAPTVDTLTEIVFALTVSDGVMVSESKSFTVTVSPAPSIVTATLTSEGDSVGDSYVAGTTITLDASASIDSDNLPLTFTWTQISGSDVMLTTVAPGVVSFVAPQLDTASQLQFEVLVDNSQGADLSSSTSLITIDVAAVESDNNGSDDGDDSAATDSSGTSSGTDTPTTSAPDNSSSGGGSMQIIALLWMLMVARARVLTRNR